jgi:hypothetical protein
MSLVRFGVFAERLAPALNEIEAVLAVPLPRDPAGKAVVAKQKIAAGQLAPVMRAALYPEDDDG